MTRKRSSGLVSQAKCAAVNIFSLRFDGSQKDLTFSQSAALKLQEECFGLGSIRDCLAVCFEYIDFGICEVVLPVVSDFSEFKPLLMPEKQGRQRARAAVWWILKTVPYRFCEVAHRGIVLSNVNDVVISSGS